MKIYPPDNRFIQEVYEGNEYGFLYHYPVVVDVGANIGTFSFWIYDHADKIYAIEPAQENVDYMLQTIEENKLDKISVVQRAVSDQSIVKHMVSNTPATEGGWAISESGTTPVTCITLKEFIESRDIPYVDLLKIDTEGHELNILGGDLFPDEKVGTIIGETHGNNGPKIIERLTWLGYHVVDCPAGHFLARKE